MLRQVLDQLLDQNKTKQKTIKKKKSQLGQLGKSKQEPQLDKGFISITCFEYDHHVVVLKENVLVLRGCLGKHFEIKCHDVNFQMVLKKLCACIQTGNSLVAQIGGPICLPMQEM